MFTGEHRTEISILERVKGVEVGRGGFPQESGSGEGPALPPITWGEHRQVRVG